MMLATAYLNLFIDGLSFREIARRMDVSKNTVIYHFEKAEKIIKSFF